MTLSLSDTSYLPPLRVYVLSLLAVSSIATLLMSIATLAYELRLTVGYNKPIPALVVCSALSLIHASLFLSPVSPTSSSRTRLVVLSIQVELASSFVLALFTLATILRLNMSTPGLFSSCGGYFICVSLQACYALAWFDLLFLLLSFVPTLSCTIYHARRSRSLDLFSRPFVLFDWTKYRKDQRIGLGIRDGIALPRTQRGVEESASDARSVAREVDAAGWTGKKVGARSDEADKETRQRPSASEARFVIA